MSLVLAMDKIWFVTQTLAFSVKKFSSESNVQKFNAKSMGRKKKKRDCASSPMAENNSIAADHGNQNTVPVYHNSTLLFKNYHYTAHLQNG